MPQAKTKVVKPNEISLESPHKTDLPKVALPKDENKQFDEDDEHGMSTIPDLSMVSEEEETPQ